jgi:hypothetical protein
MTAIDTDAIDVTDDVAIEPGREIVQATPPALAVMPVVTAEELVGRLGVIKEAAERAMTEGVDYGEIPGTNKPTLLKPGAEKLGVLFQLDVQLSNEKRWGPGDHLTVTSHATVFHAPSGSRLGYGEGVCTTRERKYAYRNQDRACPECGANTIKRSKFPPRDNPQADPGWYCFGKIGGCGANFAAGDERITGQPVGEIDNPDLPDLWNTVVKMAEKRARVDAVLAVTGASALFTQDIEDQGPAPPAEPPVSNGQPTAAQNGAATAANGTGCITKARAKLIVDSVHTVGVAEKLQLAASHAAGRDVGDCSTKAKAQLALASLTDEQAQKVEQWVERKADEAAS